MDEKRQAVVNNRPHERVGAEFLSCRRGRWSLPVTMLFRPARDNIAVTGRHSFIVAHLFPRRKWREEIPRKAAYFNTTACSQLRL